MSVDEPTDSRGKCRARARVGPNGAADRTVCTVVDIILTLFRMPKRVINMTPTVVIFPRYLMMELHTDAMFLEFVDESRAVPTKGAVVVSRGFWRYRQVQLVSTTYRLRIRRDKRGDD